MNNVDKPDLFNQLLSYLGRLWLSKLQKHGALIGNTDEFTNTLADGLAPNTILFGVFQSISGYGGHYPCRLAGIWIY